MIVRPRGLEPPPDEAIIWRYLTVPKLLGMLTDRGLHLTRLDAFKDPWEGVMPNAYRQRLMVKLNAEGHHLRGFDKLVRRSVYVNCWNMLDYQSAALWDQYAGGDGVAIQSTVGRLKAAAEEQAADICISTIRYFDFESGDAEDAALVPFSQAFFKRRSFSHENELRLAFYNSTAHEKTYWKMPLNLKQLIEKMYVTPTAEKWLLPCIQQLLEKYGLSSIPVEQSDLYSPRVT